jgi:hypothetical protein
MKGFRKYEVVIATVLHELAHNVHSEHDASFWALNSQLNKEYKAFNWTLSGGGCTPPNNNNHNNHNHNHHNNHNNHNHIHNNHNHNHNNHIHHNHNHHNHNDNNHNHHTHNDNNHNHNNRNKHAYAGATDSFTHPRVRLVLTDRGILAPSVLGICSTDNI